MSDSVHALRVKATETYIQSLANAPLPLPAVMESELLTETKALIAIVNLSIPKGEKLRMPQRLTPWQIAQLMNASHTFKKIAMSGLNGSEKSYDVIGMYQEDGPDKGLYIFDEDDMRSIARKYDDAINGNEFEEILRCLREECDRVERCSDPNLIAVNNGIFDYNTKTLMPFSPEYVFTSKSRVNYNPLAVNVNIHNENDGTDWDVESWMHTLSDDDDIVDLFWEILGAIVRPNVSWDKSAWFYSETGNNGKGTLCELMRQLCGDGSYAAIKLNDMDKDFVLEPVIHATAIICDENDVGTFIDKAANLKALITGDPVQINRKFKQPIAYRFRGFMVQCINEMPKVKDKSDSFYRRQLFVPFTKCFKGIERKYIKDDYMHRQEVLEYVLQKVLNMNYTELSEPDACKDALDEYKEFNDPTRAFWEEMKDQFAWDLLPSGFLYDLYRSWYSKNIPTGSPSGKIVFMKTLRPIATASGEWFQPKQDAKRSNKMDAPEMLISQYNLRDWMNVRYLGTTDLTKLCTYPVQNMAEPEKEKYQALQRTSWKSPSRSGKKGQRSTVKDN